MQIEQLSSSLLERLANSIHDRKSHPDNFCFNVAEKHIVEDWLNEMIKKIYKEINNY